MRALDSQNLSTTATCSQYHGYGRSSGLKIRLVCQELDRRLGPDVSPATGDAEATREWVGLRKRCVLPRHQIRGSTLSSFASDFSVGRGSARNARSIACIRLGRGA